MHITYMENMQDSRCDLFGESVCDCGYCCADG